MKTLYASSIIQIPCLVIKSLPITIASAQTLKNKIQNTHVPLADPTFNDGSSVDVILGSNVFWSSLLPDFIPANKNFHRLQNTTFGWVVGGSSTYDLTTLAFHKQSGVVNELKNFTAFAKESDLNRTMTKFWDVEEGCMMTRKSENNACEILFKNTTTVNPDGKFVVRLPLREDPKVLGDSKRMALRRLYFMEQKL